MKTWQKLLIVVVSGGAVWGLSFVSSIKPEMAMILASANATIVGLCSYFTDFSGTK
jgi:hypothetical protein